MAQDTSYAPVSFLYQSHGLTARAIADQPPPNTYLDLLNCLERAENIMSSRYGTVIINRDPLGFGTSNYPFLNAINSMSRLSYKGQSWRYAGDTGGILYRLAGGGQGQFSQIRTGLSGQPWQSVVTNCFETALPFNFIYDANVSIKDTGAGTPTLTGIDPSPNTLNTYPYAPLLLLVDSFAAGNSYATTGFSGGWNQTSVATLNFQFGVQVTDFPQMFNANVGSLAQIANGMLSNTGSGTVVTQQTIFSVISIGLSGGLYQLLQITMNGPHGVPIGGTTNCSIQGTTNSLIGGYYLGTSTGTNTLTVPFPSAVFLNATGGICYMTPTGTQPAQAIINNIYSVPYNPQASVWGFYGQAPTVASNYPINAWQGSVGQNTEATVKVTANFDLSQNNQVTDDDLIVLTIAVSNAAAVDNIRLQFDIAGSQYTTSYYYKDIAPAYFQTGVQNLETAYTTQEQQILANTLGLTTSQPPNSTTAQLQPGNLGTGSTSWIAVRLRRGDFVPVGTAGESGVDWARVSGWELIIDTNTIGASTVACNGLYLQWGYGPTSFGGVGFDYRQTYYNDATGTESNGTPIQNFGGSQYGWVNSLVAPIVLSQANQLTGLYSNDPQVTYLRFYRRGGVRSSNWFQLLQIPNIVGGGQFQIKDVVPDAVLAQAAPLILDNDPPVTSSLQAPIITSLSAATVGPGFSVFSGFAPQTITVSQAGANFVPNQIVDIGYSYNLEQTRVIAGGVGTFSAIVRLQHNAGEPVAVYSIPRMPCNLCALAYDQVWLGGDTNNPHYLYYSKRGRPESFGPQQYIPVGSPQYPIKIIVNWRGTLFVATTQTWWIINGGAQPVAQPTGSIHGAVSSTGWCQTESAVWYLATDGLRQFVGADGNYMTLPIEFLYRQQQSLTPVPVLDPARVSSVVMAYYNNVVYQAYWALNGNRYRIAFDTVYQRFRYDDVPATAMLWEPDTNVLLAAKVLASGPNVGQNYIVQDQVLTQDYDDGGYSGGTLAKLPVQMIIQSPFYDLGKPHYPKQWNMLETDCNTFSQTMLTQMIFNTEPPVTIPLAAINTGNLRDKVQLIVSEPAGFFPNQGGGDGFEAYSASIRHTISVTTAPILYQENVYAAMLADPNVNFDTYWIKLGSDESKIIKQGYFDYTSAAEITIRLFADGNPVPYYTFTLPASPSQNNRLVIRKLFRAWKPRLWRMIAISTDQTTNFQFWAAPQIESKAIDEGAKGYARTDLNS